MRVRASVCGAARGRAGPADAAPSRWSAARAPLDRQRTTRGNAAHHLAEHLRPSSVARRPRNH